MELMKQKKRSALGWQGFVILLGLALWLGSYYRFKEVKVVRPMHTDEANLATKTVELMKTGVFHYDPHDHHGPVLHYLTRGCASFKGWSPDNIQATQLRWTVAICGMLVILTVLPLLDALGFSGAVGAAFLTALSPIMVYYSRYYIMETLFVLELALFFAAIWRWSRSGQNFWLVPAGILLGLMHATKETFVLNMVAAILGWLWMKLIGFGPSTTQRFQMSRRKTAAFSIPTAILITVLLGAAVSVTFYSSFFKDWTGVKDSVLTYMSYVKRSGGSGHEKPWYYYLTVLFWTKNGLLWTEGMIGVLAIAGIISGPALGRSSPRRNFVLWLGGYAIAALAIYSVIPYKTPWTILSVQHALILLAGIGFAAILKLLSPFQKWMWIGLFLLGLYHLSVQDERLLDRYGYDQRTPYVYSHTTMKAVELAQRIHELAQLSPTGKDLAVQVIDRDDGWPLPWYLRDLHHVGYQTTLPDKLDAPVVVVDSDWEDEARHKAPDITYESRPFYSLRPDVLLTLMVEKNLWERYQAQYNPGAVPAKQEAPPPAKPSESNPPAPAKPGESPPPTPSPDSSAPSPGGPAPTNPPAPTPNHPAPSPSQLPATTHPTPQPDPGSPSPPPPTPETPAAPQSPSSPTPPAPPADAPPPLQPERQPASP